MATPGAFNTVSPSGSDEHWRVSASTSPSLILSSSQNERSHASVFNNSAGSLFLRFGGSNVSVTGIFDVKLTSGSYFEIPKPVWQGEIWGVWDAAGGYAMVASIGDND